MDILWSRWVQIWQIYPYIGWQFQPPSTDILWSRWVQIWQIYSYICWQSYTLVRTSSGQDEFKFGRSTPRYAGRSIPWYWHLVVKMSSNLANLPIHLLADPPPWYWHLLFKMVSNLADLPPGTDISQSRWVQIWQIYPRSAGRSIPWYWHLVVKMSSNLADLPLDLL